MSATTGPGPRAHSVYQERWYLDAVAPGWQEATVEQDGAVVARLPYVMVQRAGLTVVTQPGLTHTLGPWTQPVAKSPLHHEHARLTALEERLPPCDRFEQAFSPEILNGLPFHWAGYELGLRYTHRLELRSDDELSTGLAERVRDELERAREQLTVRAGLPVDQFVDVWSRSLPSTPSPQVVERLGRLDAACAARGAHAILGAEDEHGRIHAVTWVVWSGAVAHRLLSAADPAPAAGGAATLLAWEALRRARTEADTFDFSADVTPRPQPYPGDLGARQSPYLVVSRGGARAQAVLAVRGLAAAARDAATGQLRRSRARRRAA